jgi:uncharacterized protein YraI
MADRIIYKTSDGREFDRERDGRRWQDYLDTGIYRADNGYYEGEMTRSGMLHGFGKFTFDEGHVYEGYYHYNNRHGKGKYTFKNGDVYEGEYANGKYKGNGKFTWAEGTVLEGVWDDDNSVRGKKTYTDGNVYEGNLYKWKPHGKGKMTYSDGTVKEGYFYEGDFVGDLADFVKIEIGILEKEISDYVSSNGYCWYSYIDKWEELTGRKLTRADKIRIAGKSFKIKKPDSDSSSSASSSGNDVEPRGKFLSAVFGLVCGLGATLAVGWVIINMTGMAKLPAIPGIIMIVVGFIATFDSYRWKKNVVFLVLLALSVPGWLIMFRIIPEHVNLRQSIKSATAQTTQTLAITQQADITQNVNFRKGPSTNDEVIRQLKQGDTVTLTGEVSGGWTQITHDGDTGWVSSEFLKVWGGGQTAAPQTAEPKKAAPQAAALTAFPSDFTGTWKRDNYGNTLTFTEKTLKSSTQSYTWNFVSETNNAYTIHSDTSGTAKINIRLLNGNLEISGDSGYGEDNWNGTWKKQ